jgi:hypothetical protein
MTYNVDNYLKGVDVYEVSENALKHISNGGSLTEFCSELGIDYQAMVLMLDGDKEMRAKYNKAKEARKEWASEMVFEEIIALARANFSDMYTDTGELLPFTKMPAKIKKAIQSIKRTSRYDKDGNEIVTTEVKLYDKLKALELVGKDSGRFIQKHEVNKTVTLENLLTDSFNKDD